MSMKPLYFPQHRKTSYNKKKLCNVYVLLYTGSLFLSHTNNGIFVDRITVIICISSQ